ncbi:phosphate transporter [Aspergillus sclerotiicarbonarius CBS 121057]|uniref:Phosphate transporter n=1 Tax=Aspergillus sclerotiicarbonarius (strain CBS 121057 / IBT 28362) TaxID=1448318 RepID=A0A319EIK0_ASPSB|nr:phosphate transporter [Aspergillus sclerotiicarbonarius CBS 121057]
MLPIDTAKYDWILALASIALFFCAFGNGANDVANSYATSVAARTLRLWHVGILAAMTEFIGAVALGAPVTETIKNSIIDVDRFAGHPGAYMLAMGCAEVGGAIWLMFATSRGWPVSTTQTMVASLVAVGFASQAHVDWTWTHGSVSQIAASWGVAPFVSCVLSALIFGAVKCTVLGRADPFKWAMRLIPVYFAFTGAILALFIVIAAPTASSPEAFGAGKAAGIVLGVFVGCLIVATVFFLPYFHRVLVKGDVRVRFYHLPLGPWLLRDDCLLYWPAVPSSHENGQTAVEKSNSGPAHTHQSHGSDLESAQNYVQSIHSKPEQSSPRDRFLTPTQHLPWLHPRKYWSWTKFLLLQGVTRDVLTTHSDHLRSIHARAHRYDDRVEYLWRYCLVLAAILMSIAHGSNDVANAVAPWAGIYATYRAGAVDTQTHTPVWFLVIAGVVIGAGFWVYGYHVVRTLGNGITRMTPTRGFAVELGAAVTVLVASRLGLPVSTTQCLTGAATGVALMNYDIGAVNWRQLGGILLAPPNYAIELQAIAGSPPNFPSPPPPHPPQSQSPTMNPFTTPLITPTEYHNATLTPPPSRRIIPLAAYRRTLHASFESHHLPGSKYPNLHPPTPIYPYP